VSVEFALHAGAVIPTECRVMVHLEPVDGGRESWIPLLLEADDAETIVRSYLDRGELLAIREDGRDVGVALLLREGDRCEIKNLAISPERRGRGLGTQAIELIAQRSRDGGATKLVVGTANSSLPTIRFYQRAGFRMSHVVRGFFDGYPEPIWEQGIRARDMIVFDMEL
jgi:ribosomal protein S18 acetylase RimI-like enzyme